MGNQKSKHIKIIKNIFHEYNKDHIKFRREGYEYIRDIKKILKSNKYKNKHSNQLIEDLKNTEITSYRYKRSNDYIITLELLDDSITNENRSTNTHKVFCSFRTNKCRVVSIKHIVTGKSIPYIRSERSKNFIYKTGEIIEEFKYDFDKEKINSDGIHYYLLKEMAIGRGKLVSGFTGTLIKNDRHEIKICCYNDGKLHNEDKPAEILMHIHLKTKIYSYYRNGKRYYKDGLNVVKNSNTTTYYFYKNNQLHRRNGPAEIHISEGSLYSYYFYRHGKLHRENGPAKFINKGQCFEAGEISYYYNDKLHRKDGPACMEKGNTYCKFKWYNHGSTNIFNGPYYISRNHCHAFIEYQYKYKVLKGLNTKIIEKRYSVKTGLR